MGMSEEYLQQLKEDLKKVTDQLRETRCYIKELKIHHCIDTGILAGLVAVVLLTFFYLLFASLQTDLDRTLYMFCLLIGPSGFFLFLLHSYELYGFMKQGEKSIPLTLDLMYFIYTALSFATMVGLNTLYQHYQISQAFLTAGWGAGVILLCSEVPFALLCAKYVVTIGISKRLPHFFDSSSALRRKRPLFSSRYLVRSLPKPKQVYYFRKKPDVSLWQKEEYFVRYK